MILASTCMFGFVCLVFKSTRLVGVVTLSLMTYQNPLLLILLSALMGTYLYFKYSKSSGEST